ncbi:serine protease 7-like [Lucilia cuprina]|uniref:serine protease 7-like n=1 Tax=Lucilia cuprina TaxID=7375 RepID=UPI001F05212D|nr:serine protease 7-like [Lucilia cuprina]
MTNKQKIIFKQFTLIFSIFIIKIQAFAYEAPPNCYNPNGRSGLCVSIYQCPSLLNAIKTHEQTAFAFARKSECQANDQGRRPYVCCTSDTGFTTRHDLNADRIIFPSDSDYDDQTSRAVGVTTTSAYREKETFQKENSPLFPKPPVCGPINIGNKIYGGEETELGEFPWLGNLEYKKLNGDIVSVCAGNIINERYLLTAAHCVKGEIEVKIGKLVSVRVGDHNTQTPVDCNNFGCLDDFQRMSIEKIIVHSNYGSYNGYHNYNDIALIRTDRNIQYSISVAPICLPNAVPQVPQLRSGIKLSVAGWGHTGTARYSAEKRKVELPYVENQICPIKVAPEQLCAGGEYKKDSCTGDSGGGLVRLAGDAWVVEGIVSYGRGCGLERPGVYTRVSSYIPWIQANVQP